MHKDNCVVINVSDRLSIGFNWDLFDARSYVKFYGRLIAQPLTSYCAVVASLLTSPKDGKNLTHHAMEIMTTRLASECQRQTPLQAFSPPIKISESPASRTTRVEQRNSFPTAVPISI